MQHDAKRFRRVGQRAGQRVGQHRGRRTSAGGFTLVELSVVVTIVGVLAVLAVVGYRKITLSAKVSEAQNMISAIRIAQEDYKVERGNYLDLSAAPWCPSPGTAQAKTDWNTTTCTPFWAALPVHVDGPVQFGYKVTASPGTLPTTFVNTAAIAAAGKPWYVIQAQADLNGDGALMTELVGTSAQNTIFSRQDGE